ncbi:MAG: hypothetical protein WCO86_01230 [Planctomycetota bacterium]
MDFSAEDSSANESDRSCFKCRLFPLRFNRVTDRSISAFLLLTLLQFSPACYAFPATDERLEEVSIEDVDVFLEKLSNDLRLSRDAVSTWSGKVEILDRHLLTVKDQVFLETWNLRGTFLLDNGTDELLSLLDFSDQRRYYSISDPALEVELSKDSFDHEVSTAVPRVWVRPDYAYLLNSDIVFGVRIGDPHVKGWFSNESNLIRKIVRENYDSNLRRGLVIDPRKCYDPYTLSFRQYMKDIAGYWATISTTKSLVRIGSDKYRLAMSNNGKLFEICFSQAVDMNLTSVRSIDEASSAIVDQCTILYEEIGGEFVPVKFSQQIATDIDGTKVLESRDVHLSECRINEPIPSTAFSFSALGSKVGDRVQDMSDNTISMVADDAGTFVTVEDFERKYIAGFGGHSLIQRSPWRMLGIFAANLFVIVVLAAIAWRKRLRSKL